MTIRCRAVHPARLFFCTCMLALLSSAAFSQVTLLDDFETLSGWTPITSEGAKLTLGSAPGKTGRALVMDFDLSGVYGYVIAEKEFPLALPSDYQFTFDMRADAPVNNFEFKLIDDHENVHWIKKLNVEYPKEWTRQRIKKRHLSFAWGPAPDAPLRNVRRIQFVVSVGTGGKGKVFLDNFRFERVDSLAGLNARARIVGPEQAKGTIDQAGTLLSDWHITGAADGRQSLVIDFQRRREVGGLVIDWDSSDYATAYDVLFSDDGKEFSKAYSVTNGTGLRHYLPLGESEGNVLRLDLLKGNHAGRYAITRMEIKGPEFASSPNAFFRSLAADARGGIYPKYLLNKQSYWTIIGVNGDTKEALMNEQGQIEVDRLQFSLEPFLEIDGHLVTWSDVTTTPALEADYLPCPSVTWNYRDLWKLNVEAVAAGVPGNCLMGIRYSLLNNSSNRHAKLFVAIRPFQVNPPWQQLNIDGGVSRIDSIRYRYGVVQVNSKLLVPMTAPSAFGAVEFDQGQITEYLARGTVPSAQEVHDHTGYASGALEYDVKLNAGETRDIYLAVPFHGYRGSPAPSQPMDGGGLYYRLMKQQTMNAWVEKLNRLTLRLPAAAQNVANTLKSTLAYIFINRDGPGIQPGSRSYERSWIRDGALTCSALLRTGNYEEVREFIDWYAKYQFPNGKIPCVVDARGPDAVNEHDSNGEFIYAVMQYFRFTNDTLWLRGKFDAVVKTVRYLQSLRAERKTDTYRNGTPAQQALFGLIPESISHEGYWAVPRHSYWDDFFALRGFKDAATIAGILSEKALEKEFAAERDDFRADLYASMRLAMKNASVDYIPGCAELGDFDATSTTIGLSPGGELGNIPEPQLHNTFDKYYRYITDRKTNETIVNYTPYEMRTIGSFVLLDQKQRAEEALEFFMNDRRPAAWNEWAEVVWRDPETPKYIGDMPHTWVGSDFIRSVLSMFLYERERDSAVVLAAGIPDAWIRDTAGVAVRGLRTYDGLMNYSLKMKGNRLQADISGTVTVPEHRVVLKSPLGAKIRSARVNGAKTSVSPSGEIRIKKLPARVELSY